MAAALPIRLTVVASPPPLRLIHSRHATRRLATPCRSESFGSVESVKAASDVYTPVAGEITEVNEDLEDNPGVVNESPIEEVR